MADWEEALDAWLGNYKESTLKAYGKAFKQAFEIMQAKSIRDVTPEKLKTYGVVMAKLIEDSPKALAAVRTNLRALRSFMKYCAETKRTSLSIEEINFYLDLRVNSVFEEASEVRSLQEEISEIKRALEEVHEQVVPPPIERHLKLVVILTMFVTGLLIIFVIEHSLDYFFNTQTGLAFSKSSLQVLLQNLVGSYIALLSSIGSYSISFLLVIINILGFKWVDAFLTEFLHRTFRRLDKRYLFSGILSLFVFAGANALGMGYTLALESTVTTYAPPGTSMTAPPTPTLAPSTPTSTLMPSTPTPTPIPRPPIPPSPTQSLLGSPIVGLTADVLALSSIIFLNHSLHGLSRSRKEQK
jgi:hypothetical protein